MEIFFNHIISWTLVILFLVGAFYAMKMIQKESLTFLDESYLVEFGKLLVPIPTWWTQVRSEENSIRFERTDTRYDWFANFEWISGDVDKKLEDLLVNKLTKDSIQLDEHETLIETDSRVIIKDLKTAHFFQECIRVEGTATENEIERIYYDVVFLRGLNEKGYFVLESKSSVLNGSLEGPFFEECLKEIKWNF